MIYGINALFLLFAGCIWSKDNYIDVMIKIPFIILSMLNGVLFIEYTNINYPWIRNYMGF